MSLSSSPESLASPVTPPALAAAHELEVIAAENAVEDSPVCVGQRVRFEADCVLIPDPSPVSRMPRLVTKSYAVPLWRKRNQSQEPFSLSDSETETRDDGHVVLKVSVPRCALPLIRVPACSVVRVEELTSRGCTVLPFGRALHRVLSSSISLLCPASSTITITLPTLRFHHPHLLKFGADLSEPHLYHLRRARSRTPRSPPSPSARAARTASDPPRRAFVRARIGRKSSRVAHLVCEGAHQARTRGATSARIVGSTTPCPGLTPSSEAWRWTRSTRSARREVHTSRLELRRRWATRMAPCCRVYQGMRPHPDCLTLPGGFLSRHHFTRRWFPRTRNVGSSTYQTFRRSTTILPPLSSQRASMLGMREHLGPLPSLVSAHLRRHRQRYMPLRRSLLG